jgi:DNA-binding MarR family transcriptional regulator
VSDDRSEVTTQLRRGVTRLARRLRAERGPDALSANRIGVLAHLLRAGPASPGAIAAAERQLPQSLTRVFAELEADGLVLRSPSERDRRAALLHLTPAGREALARDMAVRDRWLADALGDLGPAEIEVLRQAGPLLERLAEGTEGGR